MPRSRRVCVGGICFHVINRGNRRETVFHDPGDYKRFVSLLARTHRVCPTRLVAFCLMPNHFHLVVWPREDGELSRFLHVLTTTHVRRYHMKYGTSGRIWQERFKSFPIQQDEHLLRVLMYVERNPVRAALVHLAADWPWSSVHWWRTGNWPEYADPGPVPRPEEWDSLLTGDEQPAEVEMLRRHVERGRPFGERGWIEGTAMALRLTQTLRDRGRPGRCRKEKGASPLL